MLPEERLSTAPAARECAPLPELPKVGSVDLRTLDRHPGGAISSVIPSLSCRRCSPNAPFTRLGNVDGGTAAIGHCR
jgi:hypothetical protein